MTGREIAWRVCAFELSQSTETDREGGARGAYYLVSPVGAQMNRVVLAGTLPPPDRAAGDDANPFWRSRFSDPSGSLAVTAGAYQPRAQGALRALSTPASCLVVGKPHLYVGRNGVGYPSVRAEAIRPLTPPELREWQAEIVRHLERRVELRERLEREPEVSDTILRAERLPARWISAARLALSRYRSVDLARYRAAARTLADGERPMGEPTQRVPESNPTPGTVRVVRAERPSATPSVSPANPELERELLDRVDEESSRSTSGYVDTEQLVRALSARGATRSEVEQAVDRLEETGVLEEPIVGKIRRA